MRILLLFTILLFCNVVPAQQVEIRLWKDSVMGAIYNKATNTVAYGKPDKNGNYKIYLSDLNGNNETMLTYSEWSTERQQWAEEWHPSGEYLFVYIEKTEYIKEKKHNRKAVDAIPGYGAYCDLWLVKRDGSKAWKLLDLPNDYNSGIIHAAISEDGTLFAWSERVKAPEFLNFNLTAGSYVMRIADFSIDSAPRLSNIRTFKPGHVDALNELDGISPDKKTISFYSTYETKNIFTTPIYTLHLESGEIKRLTTESFAQAPTYTPDGKKLIYMTGAGCDIFPFEIQGADWWIMNTDGSEKRRLTYMNKKDHPHSVNHYRLAGCISFVNDSTFLGGVMTKPLGLTGKTVMVRFK